MTGMTRRTGLTEVTEVTQMTGKITMARVNAIIIAKTRI